jgi:small GTP-binding protein
MGPYTEMANQSHQ